MVLSILTGVLRRTVGLSLLAAVMLAVPSPSHAQSFFEALFGGSKPAPSAIAPRFNAPQRLAPVGAGLGPGQGGGLAPLSQGRSPMANYARPSRQDDDDDGAPKGGKGGQRTVCVRLCDGYYWPVSFQTKRSQFQRDARACESSCDGEARLFHFPSYGDINDAVDNAGKSYARLPAAFVYRKKLVAGCTCRPEAWSDAEVSRHQVYAMDEAQEKARIAEAKAAEEARIAAVEAAKVEAQQRLAEAKLQAKTPGGQKSAALKGKTVLPADGADADASGSVTVAAAPTPTSSGAGDLTVDADPTLSNTSKARSRRARDNNASATRGSVIRTAFDAESTRRPRPQAQTHPRPQSASVSAASGVFAKKYAWPGD